MKKKLLTLDDLVKFCKEQKLYSFSAKESGKQIFVQVPASFEKKEDENSLLMFVNVKAFHTGRNRNGSSVTVDAAKQAMKTMAYKPILANFTEDENGNLDFTSHDTDVDEDGNIVYLEHQIGCFTADAPYLEQDPDNEDRQYVYATAAIPRDYTAAADIIERKDGTKVSVELAVNELSYDSKNKTLILSDVEVSGLTCLGTDPNTGEAVEEGMQGARLDIADFSKEKNSVHFENDEKTIEIMQELKQTLDNYIAVHTAQNFEKGGNDVEDIKEVEVTETPEENTEVEMAAEEEVVEEAATEESTEEDADTEAEDEAAEETPSEDFEDEPEDEEKDNFATLSVTVNGETKTFSASLLEKLNALYTLVNETYGESDNDFYDVDADEENKEVYMHGWFGGKHYKQKYSVKKDVFSLQGDRVSVYTKYLTEDEIKKLDDMKANYAEISDKLAKYEAEPEKMSIIESEEYSSISDSEDYVAFKAQDAHFDLSVDEVRAKCDEMLLNAAKAGKVDFAKSNDDSKKEIGMKKLPVQKPKKSGRYGSIFSKNEN